MTLVTGNAGLDRSAFEHKDGLMSTSDTYEVYAIRYGTFDKRMRRANFIRLNWNDTEKISISPAQGWHAQIEKLKPFQ